MPSLAAVAWSLAVPLALAAHPAGAAAQSPARGPLVIFSAGSLARPMSELARAFAERTPGVQWQQESSGSLEAARKLTELGKVPDVLAVADHRVLEALIVPRHARWYANFARGAMVLAYTERSAGASEINGQNWWRILLRPGVRTGRADPVLDPNGYRTLMVLQLAERHYQVDGLAARLQAAMPRRFVRAKEADLVALLQAGELDYAWSYRSLAATLGLRYVELPPEIDLRDTAFAAAYAAASVRLPGATRRGADSVTFRGEPIRYALTVPAAAPHPELAHAFAQFALSPDGLAILRRNLFLVDDRPSFVGDPPAGLVVPVRPRPPARSSR